MTELLKIDSFKGMVTDVSDGKQPQGTCKEIKNMVYDREYGSLVTRYTYENSIARPSGVSTLTDWLSFPVTYPSATDHHLWFTEDGVYQYNYWHNSATMTNGWVLVTESKDLSSISSGDVTVNASPTNTIVIDNADTTWGLSTSNDYYKNWVFQGTGGNTATYFVKSYSFAGHTSTFTLDNVLTIDWAVIPDYKLFRYFHKDYAFTPSFTYPAGYSTETAFRWSGGAGSTAGLKNIKSGYLNKIFFNNSGTTHAFTGTYIDQAECSAPSSSLLKSSTFTTTAASDKIIKLSKDYDFDSSTVNWSSNGTHTVSIGQATITNAIGTDPFGNINTTETPINGLLIKTAGADGNTATDFAGLASSGTYLESVTSGASYRMTLKGFSADAVGKDAKVKIRIAKSDDSVYYDSNELTFRTDDQIGRNGTPFGNIDTQTFDFTPSFTGVPKIYIYLTDTGNGSSYSVILTSAQISLVSNIKQALAYGNVYKIWGTAVYDSTQESEFTYLGSVVMTSKNGILAFTLTVSLGSLNKFITSYRIYMSEETGLIDNTTSTTSAAKYLLKTIAIDSNATSTWTFNATLGKYEYADTITNSDWLNRGVTWEQKTQRTASASTTCSYFLAKMASGRVFLADDYDYADGRLYINRVRYTGFNGDGNPTPDIFPNINDVFITTITAGRSQEIRNIAEFDGDLIILKKNSILRLDTSNPDPFTWNLQLTKDGVGSRSARGAYKFDKGLFFTDLYSAYLYDGYQVRDVLKGRWRNAYQQRVTSDAIAISHLVWYNPVNDTIGIAYDTTTSDAIARNYYEFNTDSWLPVYQQNGSGYELQNLTVTSDGVIHFAPTAVGANSSKFATTVQANLVNAVVDTGYYGMPVGKLAEPKWVYVLAQLPNTSEMTVYLYGDNTTVVGQGVFTSTSSEIRLYKFQTINDMPNRMLKVYIVQNGTVAPSTKELKVMNILVEGNVVDEFTDITETVTVT